MSIRISAEQIRHAERTLRGVRGGARKAAVRAINRAMQGAKTAAANEAFQRYSVKKRQIVDTMKTTRATSSNLEARVSSRGQSIRLADFKTRPRKPMHDGRKRLMVSVERQTGYKPIEGAFLAKTQASGRLGAFIRKGKSRYPIRELFGPSIPQMLGHKDVRDVVDSRARAVLADRFDHEIGRLLARSME